MNGPEIEFDWDEANMTHVARHGVLPEEAEQVISLGNRHTPRSQALFRPLFPIVLECLPVLARSAIQIPHYPSVSQR